MAFDRIVISRRPMPSLLSECEKMRLWPSERIEPPPSNDTNPFGPWRSGLNIASTQPRQSTSVASEGNCRLCDKSLARTFIDLGMSPLCESFLLPDQLDAMELYLPLRVLVCDDCFLVQLRQYVSSEQIFREYAYFSSFSLTWV